MKYYKVVGSISCIALIISCFLPWAWYPDLHKSFTGFFSEQNIYGRPGYAFSFIGLLSLVLLFINRIWAKRTLIFMAALNLAYLLKTYVIFTGCYKGYCPVVQYGLYVLVGACLVLLAVSFFPDVRLSPDGTVDGAEEQSLNETQK